MKIDETAEKAVFDISGFRMGSTERYRAASEWTRKLLTLGEFLLSEASDGDKTWILESLTSAIDDVYETAFRHSDGFEGYFAAIRWCVEMIDALEAWESRAPDCEAFKCLYAYISHGERGLKKARASLIKEIDGEVAAICEKLARSHQYADENNASEESRPREG